MKWFLLSLLAVPASASDLPNKQTEDLPAIVRLLISDSGNQVFVRMPVIDVDPNSGSTFGIMPIWVALSSGTIRHIQLPSLTYNANVRVTGTYEHYYFPTADDQMYFCASWSERFNREFTLDYQSKDFLRTDLDFSGRFQYQWDSFKRFYGFGPDTPESGQSNYTLDTINYHFAVGAPIAQDSPFRFRISHDLQSNRVLSGSVESVPDTQTLYPSVVNTVPGRAIIATLGLAASFDTRDSPNTTSRGTYADTFVEGAHNGTIGEYSYYHYGMNLRQFLPINATGDVEPKFITALRARFDDLEGPAPFWALPELGGKYSLRSYGEGRFVDHDLLVFTAEERCRVFAARISTVMASFWIDPFIGVGTVSPTPELLQNKYFHPVYGVALRVVGRPQVVGSADFGYGQEGLKVFLDINYSF